MDSAKSFLKNLSAEKSPKFKYQKSGKGYTFAGDEELPRKGSGDLQTQKNMKRNPNFATGGND